MRSPTALAALAIVVALGPMPATPVRAQQASGADAAIVARALFDESWQWTLQEFPEIATTIGDHRYDDRLADQSASALDRRRAKRAEFLARATKLDPAALSPADRVSLRVFRYQLEQAVALDKLCAPLPCSAGDSWSPVTQFNGPQFEIPRLVASIRFASVRDYDAYLKRLDALPVQIDQLISRMELGIKL
jgi:uncharacterized protein (DUF885 family)